MRTAQTRPTQASPTRFTVDIWVERGGQDVTAGDLNKGETVDYHIRIRSVRRPSKTVYVKSIVLGVMVGGRPLVSFPHNNFSEWVCSVDTSAASPGTDCHLINVDPQNAGPSTLQALELVLVDPLGAVRERILLDLPLTIT